MAMYNKLQIISVTGKENKVIANDKTIIELGYRKISWFVSVTIFCSTSSNNC